jgi:hypothetical protein
MNRDESGNLDLLAARFQGIRSKERVVAKLVKISIAFIGLILSAVYVYLSILVWKKRRICFSSTASLFVA